MYVIGCHAKAIRHYLNCSIGMHTIDVLSYGKHSFSSTITFSYELNALLLYQCAYVGWICFFNKCSRVGESPCVCVCVRKRKRKAQRGREDARWQNGCEIKWSNKFGTKFFHKCYVDLCPESIRDISTGKNNNEMHGLSRIIESWRD